MRIVLSAAVLIFVCCAVFAQEVVFEKQENKSDRALAYVKTDSLKFQNTEKPDGVTAPEGELLWGKLVLGRKSYIACYIEKGRKLVKLWIDRDNDRDLKEETPGESKNNTIRVEKITGEFPFGVGTLEREMCIVFTFFSHRNGYVGLCEKYNAQAEIEDMKITVSWTLGQEPRFKPESWRREFPTLYFGKLKLAMGTKDLTIKEEKIVGKLQFTEARELVETKAPEHLHAVTLHKRVSGWNAASVPSLGKVYLPEGKYSAVWADMRKKSEDGEYRLKVLLGSRDYEIKEGITLGPVEPLTLAPQVTQRGDKVYVRANLSSALKGRTSLLKNGGRLDPPKLVITDSEGAEVASHVFKPG